MRHATAALMCLALAGPAGPVHPQDSPGGQATMVLDPVTRYFHVTYAVPAGAPDEVTVLCSWSPAGEDARRSKSITITQPHHLDAYSPWERLRIWTDGIEMGELEVHLDDALASQSAGPPYLVGTEELDSDGVIPTGEHTLLVRARDGDGWLEATFDIKGH